MRRAHAARLVFYARAVRTVLSLAALLASTAVSVVVHAADPVGYLDNASCDAIVGWAQDPDVPAQPIAVHIYFGGPAGSGALGVSTPANVNRADLCTAIGSCEHGFVLASPLSLHDGVPHDIFAYGINDAAGGANPVLGSAPRTLTCPPAPQSGIKRRVDGLPTLDAWRFSAFWDLLPPGGGAETLAEGPNLPAAPRLVRADDGSTDVWLIDADGHLKRHVAPEIAPAWRFDLTTAEIVDSARLGALTEGTPLRARPVTFIDGSLFIADDPQPDASSGPSLDPESVGEGDGGGDAGGGDAGGSDTGAGGGDDGSDGSSGGGCTVSEDAGSGRGGGGGGGLAALLVMGAVLSRRTRRG